jgi:hypothetical protein
VFAGGVLLAVGVRRVKALRSGHAVPRRLGHAEPGCAKVKCVTLCGTMRIYQYKQYYGAVRSAEPGIHNHKTDRSILLLQGPVIMDSELAAEPVIGSRDFARARWRRSGMTISRGSAD